MQAELARIPGIRSSFSQPIALRVNELISGVRSDVAVKVFGDDMDVMNNAAGRIAAVLKGISGATEVNIEQTTGLPMLSVQIDRIVDVIAKAQQPDGYIASQTTVRGWPRFQDAHHHELYTMGHLLTAACIHHRITGKTALLDVACKTADCVYETFKGRDPKLAEFPRNPSIIMGAVELYRTTGNKKYLDMANFFIDWRGSRYGNGRRNAWGGPLRNGSDLNQNWRPLRKETEVVGHAVFFTYLYAGAADAYMETGDTTLLAALDRLWTDLVTKKMYITGGVSPEHKSHPARSFEPGKLSAIAGDSIHEGISAPYELPNDTAYNETCGQIGNLMWNWRMLAITGEPRFADVMERTLYNSILSGIEVDGEGWSYTNPLRWHGAEHVLREVAGEYFVLRDDDDHDQEPER